MKRFNLYAHHANEEWVIVLRGEPTLRRRAMYTRTGKIAARRFFPLESTQSITRVR
jgi:uncharacterized cupin superfamily protein